jgi:hypothetical protein
MVEATVGSRVGETIGATVDPQAARPTVAIAAPMMVVRFMSALTDSTGTVINGYNRANASNVILRVIDLVSRRDGASLPRHHSLVK